MKDGWKYIIYNIKGEKKEQLFNLNEDPWEMVNLAEMPAYAFLKNAYKRLLKEEMKKNNDFCNLDDFYWWGKPGMISWDESLKLYVAPNQVGYTNLKFGNVSKQNGLSNRQL